MAKASKKTFTVFEWRARRLPPLTKIILFARKNPGLRVFYSFHDSTRRAVFAKDLKTCKAELHRRAYSSRDVYDWNDLWEW